MSAGGGPETIILKVASASDSKSVARAILKYHDEGRYVEMSAIGPMSVNQAVKAAAIAQEEFIHRGLDLTLLPRFETIRKDDLRLSAIRFGVLIQPASGEPAPIRPVPAGVPGGKSRRGGRENSRDRRD